MKRIQFAIFASVMAIAVFCAASVMAENVATAEKVSGKVEMETGVAGVWKALSAGDKLAENDRVRTGSDGEAIITWFSGNAVKMSPLTILTIKQINNSDSNTEKSILNVEDGRVFIRAKKLSSKSVFEVETPVARAGVRGTEFSTSHSADSGESDFVVLNGAIDVEAMAVSTILEANYSVSVKSGQAPDEPMHAPESVLDLMKKESAAMDEILSAETSDQKEKNTETVSDKTIEDLSNSVVESVLEQDTLNLIDDNLLTPATGCCDY